MSGRIRTIKPELLEDALTAGLTHPAFRLFIGMILLADDHGNLRASPRWLEGQVFHGQPLPDGVSMADVLAELGRKLVLFYAVEGQPYASITGWRKHQRIENAGENRVPMPPGWECVREERSDGKRLRVLLQQRRMPPLRLDPDHMGRAPAETIQPHGAGTGEEIQHARPRHHFGQHREERRTHAILRRPHLIARGRPDAAPAKLATRHAHGVSIAGSARVEETRVISHR